MRRGDVAAGLALALFALFVFVETAGYPPSPVPGSPGPAFFPRLLAGALLVFAALLVAGALRREGEPAPAVAGTGEAAATAELPPDEAAPHTPRAGRRPGRAGLTLLLAVVFLLLVERTDFFLALVPLLAAVMAIMGERRTAVLAVVPAAFGVFVYVVFQRLFGVPFPTLF